MIDQRKWSEQQEAIFGWFRDGKGNLVVRARAGTGKTTTIIEGITHSRDGKVLLAAFNKKIAEELKTRLKNPMAEAKTLHSIGFGFVLRNWSGVALDDDRGNRLARRVMGKDAPDKIVKLVAKLASIAKGVCPFPKEAQVVDLVYSFDLEPPQEEVDAGWTVEALAIGAMRAMDLAAEKDTCIDFDDMVFVPVRNRWVRGRYDLVVIDEAQDMNAAQILLARGVCKPTGRVAVIGDDRQAIYGFRGADSGSIDRLKKELNAAELGLTITYRCPSSVVKQAAVLVPDFQAAPACPEGRVIPEVVRNIPKLAEKGNFVLSRTNAALVKVCLSILKSGKPARIEGRDIGAQLIGLIKKLKGRTIPEFLKKLKTWEEGRVKVLKATGKGSAEASAQTVTDMADTLRALAEDMATTEELKARIEALFSDSYGKGDYVICSSIHRSKGLESDTVFVLDDTLYPGGRRDLEELNLEYVAVTRSKNNLYRVVEDGR